METSFSGRRIIDGDGHVMEDIAAIWKLMPPDYVGKSFSDIRGKSPFPPIDHLHSANRHFTPRASAREHGHDAVAGEFSSLLQLLLLLVQRTNFDVPKS